MAEFRLLDSEDVSYEFAPPEHSAACEAVALKDAMDARRADAKNFVAKSRLNWRHDSARQVKEIPVNADGASERLLA